MAQKQKTFKWTVEIEIDESWVADGFEISAEHMRDMLIDSLSGGGQIRVYDHEVKAKVTQSPDARSIRIVQGYEGVQ